jgi:hypothetical protein
MLDGRVNDKGLGAFPCLNVVADLSEFEMDPELKELANPTLSRMLLHSLNDRLVSVPRYQTSRPSASGFRTRSRLPECDNDVAARSCGNSRSVLMSDVL